jgi:hypothetical protein
MTVKFEARDTLVDQASPSAGEMASASRCAVLSGYGRWARFFQDLVAVLGRPTSFWQSRYDEAPTAEPSLAMVLWPHLLVLVIARGVAASIGAVAGGQSFGGMLTAALGTALGSLALVLVVAFAASVLTAARGQRPSFARSLGLAAYGLTPMLIVGMLAAIPIAHVAPISEALAMPYAFYVVGTGLVPVLRAEPARAPASVGMLNGVILVAWSLVVASVTLLGLEVI